MISRRKILFSSAAAFAASAAGLVNPGSLLAAQRRLSGKSAGDGDPLTDSGRIRINPNLSIADRGHHRRMAMENPHVAFAARNNDHVRISAQDRAFRGDQFEVDIRH